MPRLINPNRALTSGPEGRRPFSNPIIRTHGFFPCSLQGSEHEGSVGIRIEKCDDSVPGGIVEPSMPDTLLCARRRSTLCGKCPYPDRPVMITVVSRLLQLRRVGRRFCKVPSSNFAHRCSCAQFSDNQEIGSKMSTRDIEGEWRAASYFLAKGPSASVQYLQEDVKAQLFALKTQALDGDCPPGQDGSMAMDPSLRIRQEAWNALSGMSCEEAKRRFVDLLSEVLPEWKKWSADHAPRASSEEKHESEAARLVKVFRARLGSNISTQFSRL